MGPTVGEALAEFRRVNGLADDEAMHSSWMCRIGPIGVRVPNFEWRRQAILAHDLHHVLTGLPCGMRGEFQMAAWEFGAGPMPHWGAVLFCLPLVLLGLFWSPGCIMQAYRAGRRSRSLHKSKEIDRLLATPLHVARANLACVSTRVTKLARLRSDPARASLLLTITLTNRLDAPLSGGIDGLSQESEQGMRCGTKVPMPQLPPQL